MQSHIIRHFGTVHRSLLIENERNVIQNMWHQDKEKKQKCVEIMKEDLTRYISSKFYIWYQYGTKIGIIILFSKTIQGEPRIEEKMG